VRAVAEAEQDRRVLPQLVAQDHERRGPDAAADEHRPAAVAGRRERPAERAEQPQAVALAQLRQAPRPGADVLEHELQAPAARGPRDGERPRQERALVVAAGPPLRGGQHVELPRLRRRAVLVEHLEDEVRAHRPAARHVGEPAAERREHPSVDPLDGHGEGTPSSEAWISCRLTTGASSTRAAAIARAAAIPPAIVVMQAMPRATDARRIS